MRRRKDHEVWRNQSGFTLMELLIVVAIIGIIATISLPAFLKMRTKSKTAVIATDFHMVRTQVIQYNADYNIYPAETGPGVFPPELLDWYISHQFSFANPDPDYLYDWENWSGPPNPNDGGTGISIGFSVVTNNPLLGATLLKRFPTDLQQTQPNVYTWVIERVGN